MTAHTYERTMSDLTLAIGYLEKLESVTPEEAERLILTESRLKLAVSALINQVEEAA